MGSIPLRLILTPLLLLMAAVFAMQVAAGPESRPHGSASELRSHADRATADAHASDETSWPHHQKSIQRPSAERLKTAPHGSRTEEKLPPDVFESPKTKSADHIPKPLPSDEVPAIKLAAPASDLDLAWQHYNQGRYKEAIELFEGVIVKDPNRSMNARMGLAYSRLKLGQRVAAADQLKRLVNQRYRLAETLPLLLSLLEAQGDFEAEDSYLHLLSAKERERWTRRILEGRLITGFRILEQKKKPTHLEWVTFLDRYQPALDLCIRPELFYESAARLQAYRDNARAVAVYSTLRNCDLPPDLRLGVVSRLSTLLEPDAAADIIRQEKPRFRRTEPRYLNEIDRLEVLAIKRKLDRMPTSAEAQRRSAAEAILNLAPGDRDALAVLAWIEFEQHNYQQSASLFEQLLKQDPRNRDYAIGLGYSRFELGSLERALEPFEQNEIPDDDKSLKLRSLVFQARARKAYDNRDWHLAAENLEAALTIDPQDSNSKELLAWTRFQQQRAQEALALMEEVYTQKQDPTKAGSLLDMYRSAGETARSWGLARQMARGQDRQSQEKAADFFFSQGAPVSAAQIDADDQCCYTGAGAPRIEVWAYHKNKSGDDGTSELSESAFPVTLAYPTPLGNTWSVSLTPRYLSSGSAPDTPYAGSYYLLLDGKPQLNDLEDSLLVWQPTAEFEREGRVNIVASLGTSPIGGAIDPTLTLSLRLSTDHWYADLHRSTVKDSILSYTGLEDPYSSSKWGRVMRNGISAGTTWPLLENYWINVSAGYNYYSGKNLWNNDSYHFDAAFGRNFDYEGDELTVGLFFTAQHYRRNSDFYTYGHGGYYSPELLTIVGPLLRYRSAICRTYWFDLQVSGGWMHQKLDGSPVYPLFEGDVTGFTPDAAADALSVYGGDTDNKLNLSAKIQVMKLIGDQFAVGGFAGIDNNSGYNHWQVGVGLQFFFERQNAFWKRRNFFNEFGNNSNK